MYYIIYCVIYHIYYKYYIYLYSLNTNWPPILRNNAFIATGALGYNNELSVTCCNHTVDCNQHCTINGVVL